MYWSPWWRHARTATSHRGLLPHFALQKSSWRTSTTAIRSRRYCGCTYREKRPDHASCGYVPIKDNKRANRIEWEHVVPAHAFGQSFVQWRDGDASCRDKREKAFKGRNCARKASKLFRQMEADPYNLVPAIGEVNGRRSNYSMAMLDGEPRRFGGCDVEIEKRKIEPRDEIRGDVARIYMYMNHAYPGRGVVSKKNRRLFHAWDRADPVDEWECERYRRIKRATGMDNALLAEPCTGPGMER